MIWSILEHTPLWVWALFFGLVLLGIYQTRTLEVSRARATILPIFMIGLSLNGVLGAFGPVPIPLGAWVLGFWAALPTLGRLVSARGASWSATTARFRVPGSSVPPILIAGVFVCRYAGGASLAIDPHLAANTTFAGLLSLLYGFFAGLFWARARSLQRLVRGGTVAQPA